MVYKSIKNIQLTNLQRRDIMFRNFSGRTGKFNKNGDRTFCVRIPDAKLAQDLNEEGWNIKVLAPRNEDEEPVHYLPVAISFKNYPAHIYQHTGKVVTELSEDNVGNLDDVDILNVDIVIRPYQYERDDGSTGVKAYVKYMHVTVEQDPFAYKYATEESPEEDVPWNN